MTLRRMSDRGRELLTEWEGGVRLHEYLDPAGLPTIGVGHLIRHGEMLAGLQIDGRRVPYKDGISREDAMALLDADLRWVESLLNSRLALPLAQCEFDALCSLVFNIGPRRFLESTLLECLNAGNREAVPAQFRRWVNSEGQRLQGLVDRRDAEISLWEGKL